MPLENTCTSEQPMLEVLRLILVKGGEQSGLEVWATNFLNVVVLKDSEHLQQERENNKMSLQIAYI